MAPLFLCVRQVLREDAVVIGLPEQIGQIVIRVEDQVGHDQPIVVHDIVFDLQQPVAQVVDGGDGGRSPCVCSPRQCCSTDRH